ncbi:MAG: DUF1326 domain-containing protein [Acidiferrobacterales bacterium]
MAHADWMIKTKRLVSCNCNYGCPCEFNAPPTHEVCEGVEAAEIVEGYFSDVRLDGLRFAGVYRWPGPVHEGGGTYLPVIDRRANEQQVDALFKILSGEEQEPTTMFNIYGTTIDTELEPVFANIEFEWDLKARIGLMRVRDIFEATLEPIRNPVTGTAHRAVIKLPEGFEFREAEMASSTFWSKGEISQDHKGRYGFLTYTTYGPYGVIEEHSHPASSAS